MLWDDLATTIANTLILECFLWRGVLRCLAMGFTESYHKPMEV